MERDYLRPIYDYDQPLGENHKIADIFVCGTEINTVTALEDVKGINITVAKNDEIPDWTKNNYAVVTISESQLKDNEFTVEESISDIEKIVSENYEVIKKAYSDYVKEVKKRKIE